MASASVVALTTTFTPAASCTNLAFSSPIYKIWLNQPVPLPSSTSDDCYPSQWLQGYTSITSGSSIAPMLSPLVCPEGWSTAYSTSTSYIACCPSNYALHYPDSTLDFHRPAFGGTCFSDIVSGQTLTVTLFGNSSVSQTQTLTESTAGQAFAPVLDGIMVQQGAMQTPTSGLLTFATGSPGSPQPGSAVTAAASTSSAAASGGNVSNGLSGAEIAGVAVAAAVGALLLVAAGVAVFYCRRSRARKSSNSNAYPGRAPDPPIAEMAVPADRPDPRIPPPPPRKDSFYYPPTATSPGSRTMSPISPEEENLYQTFYEEKRAALATAASVGEGGRRPTYPPYRYESALGRPPMEKDTDVPRYANARPGGIRVQEMPVERDPTELLSPTGARPVMPAGAHRMELEGSAVPPPIAAAAGAPVQSRGSDQFDVYAHKLGSPPRDAGRASPSRSVSREPSRGISREPSRGISRDPSRGISRDPSRGISREASRGVSPSQSHSQLPSNLPGGYI